MTPVAIMTSDWHLSEGAWSGPNTPKGDAFTALEYVAGLAKQWQIPILAAGDLFDELKPSSAVLSRTFDILRDCEVLYIQGQHEKAYPPWLSLSGNRQIKHMHQQVARVGPFTVAGMDHVPVTHLEQAIGLVPQADIIMCHQVWSEFMGTRGEGNLEEIIDRHCPRMVLTGDFHSHLHRIVRDTMVYSPGSFCLQEISEERDKRVFFLNDDRTVQSVRLPTRKVYDLVINTENELNAALCEVDRLVEVDPSARLDIERKNVIYVKCADLPVAYSRFRAAIHDRAFLFWKTLPKETRVVTVDMSRDASTIRSSIEKALGTLVAPDGDAYKGLLRLHYATDLKTELASMAKDYRASLGATT